MRIISNFHVCILQLLGWAGLGLVILLKQNYLGTSISSQDTASYSRHAHQDLDHYPHPGTVYRSFPSHTGHSMDEFMVTWSMVIPWS